MTYEKDDNNRQSGNQSPEAGTAANWFGTDFPLLMESFLYEPNFAALLRTRRFSTIFCLAEWPHQHAEYEEVNLESGIEHYNQAPLNSNEYVNLRTSYSNMDALSAFLL